EATQPEEETFLMETGYESIIIGIRVPVPNFIRWLWGRTPRAMYAHLRLQLQYLQWQDGGRRGRPWIMKSPLHLPNFELLVDTFPGATFVHCHRDPAVCIPSMARLSEAYRGTQSDIVDTGEIGRTQLELWSEALDRYLAQRARLGGRVEVLDVGYRAIAADRTRMEDYAGANPQGRFGRFEYSLERFGLTEDDIQQRFGAYRAAFAKELA